MSPSLIRRLILRGIVLSLTLFFIPLATSADDGQALREQATETLKKAATYYRTKVASHGGYVYHYAADFSQRWGEGPAGPDQIWVQPPGTPTVGMAFLKAYEATGDKFYLQAAQDAAEALIYGQLVSGGWTNSVDFNPKGDKVAQYRNGKGKGRNNTSLDDGITQAALQLVMRTDQALGFKNKQIHEAAKIALDALLAAQFPNGGFPQGWVGPTPRHPIVKASYPSYEWRTEGKIKNYWDMYTLNDGLPGTVSATLEDALNIYQDARCKEALVKLGDFLILAQMPEPQPAWAQQYSIDMHPIWARRFEPPGVSGRESQDAMQTLMKIYELTHDEKYLAPIPPALAYLKRSLLPDGRLARYYELKTNRPLYMNRRNDVYFLTYDDSNLPSHYGWKTESFIEDLERQFDRIKQGDKPSEPTATERQSQVKKIIWALDSQGRWLNVYQGETLVGQPKFKQGAEYLSSAVFSENVEALSEYLLATR